MPIAAPHTPPEQLLDGIYGAVAQQVSWDTVLTDLCGALEGRVAVLGSIGEATKSVEIAAIAGDPALTRPLLDRYLPEVPFFSAAGSLETDVAYTVDAVYALQGPGARGHWLESRMVPEWVVPNGLDDFFWLSMSKRSGRNGALFILTDNKRRPISGYDLAWIEALSPHLRRAVAVATLLEAERAQTQVFRDLVEALAHPVAVVADDMRLLFANAAAERLLSGGGVASSRQGSLAFSYSHAAAAIARAVRLGMQDEFLLGATGVDVPLAHEVSPAVAHVLPLARRDRDARLHVRAAAAIFFGVAGGKPPPAMDAIASLFGLTPAEKRVAAQVAEGLSRKEIAAAHGVSDGTIKTQLAVIFDKTGVNDQRHLELLIREISPPIAPRAQK